jgi:2-polyprenyl-3-methyl-5-hydroxy-6-metoxy-1,4-benzoquinol methylase
VSFDSVPIEKVRKFWDDRPCNVRHSSSPVGSRQYFDEVESKRYTVEYHIPFFADFPRWRGRRVLEVGCGIGTETINFARAGAHVTAVDLSSVSLDLVRKRAEVFELPVQFVEADAEHLSDYVPGRYDLVWSFGVIHHSPHPEAILGEMAKVTEPGATLKLMVYHRRSLKVARLVKGRWWKADQLIARQSEAQTGCPVTYTYTKRQITALVEAAGFAVESVQPAHIFPYRIKPYREHRLVKHWYWRVMPPSVFRWLESRYGWHLLITARRV